MASQKFVNKGIGSISEVRLFFTLPYRCSNVGVRSSSLRWTVPSRTRDVERTIPKISILPNHSFQTRSDGTRSTLGRESSGQRGDASSAYQRARGLGWTSIPHLAWYQLWYQTNVLAQRWMANLWNGCSLPSTLSGRNRTRTSRRTTLEQGSRLNPPSTNEKHFLSSVPDHVYFPVLSCFFSCDQRRVLVLGNKRLEPSISL